MLVNHKYKEQCKETGTHEKHSKFIVYKLMICSGFSGFFKLLCIYSKVLNQQFLILCKDTVASYLTHSPPADAIWHHTSYCKSKKYLGATMSIFAKLIR